MTNDRSSSERDREDAEWSAIHDMIQRDDIFVAVLKVHIEAERFLNRLLGMTFLGRDDFDGARLSFSQKLSLALSACWILPHLSGPLRRLNTIRNALAHGSASGVRPEHGDELWAALGMKGKQYVTSRLDEATNLETNERFGKLRRGLLILCTTLQANVRSNMWTHRAKEAESGLLLWRRVKTKVTNDTELQMRIQTQIDHYATVLRELGVDDPLGGA